jgi:hypothetical protein
MSPASDGLSGWIFRLKLVVPTLICWGLRDVRVTKCLQTVAGTTEPMGIGRDRVTGTEGYGPFFLL